MTLYLHQAHHPEAGPGEMLKIAATADFTSFLVMPLLTDLVTQVAMVVPGQSHFDKLANRAHYCSRLDKPAVEDSFYFYLRVA